MKDLFFCGSKPLKPCIMEDAGGSYTGSVELTQSRKQERNDGLLGWWVSFFLILPTLAGKPVMADEPESHRKGGRMLSSSPSQNLNQSINARLARTSPPNRMPVIDRKKVDPQLLKAAEGMEAMFLNYMMKVMRQTIPRNEMDLESPATDIYRGMLDTSLTEKVAHQGGVGLADQIIAYLDPQGYNHRVGQGIPKKEKP